MSQTNMDRNQSTAATIAAVSTPAGISGVAVIRVSGMEAANFCDQLFEPVSKRFARASQMKPYTVGVGYWRAFDSAEIIDKVVLTYYQAPNSYTGENVYEISCHGGPYIRQAILQSLFDAGVEPAGPGEFSRRAFLNGKLDLAEAEAVMDMISAESSRQNQAALRQLRGKLSEQISEIRHDLYKIIAQIEMIIEFPENEDTLEKRMAIQQKIKKIHAVLESAINSFAQGRILREGFHVVIAGKPNVGKSSLLNQLLGEEKAIVTSQAGTTRDIIEAQIVIDGLSVLLTDTAGLRIASDIVEQEGIQRAYQAIERADLIFYMLSPEDESTWQEDSREIKDLIMQGKKVIVIAGKNDLAEHAALLPFIKENLPETEMISFSKYDVDKVQILKHKIVDVFEKTGQTEADSILITHLRHRQILEKTATYIAQAEQAFMDQIPLDLISGLLLAAAEELAEITGDEVSEELIETIFSEFCVGK